VEPLDILQARITRPSKTPPASSPIKVTRDHIRKHKNDKNQCCLSLKINYGKNTKYLGK